LPLLQQNINTWLLSLSDARTSEWSFIEELARLELIGYVKEANVAMLFVEGGVLLQLGYFL